MDDVSCPSCGSDSCVSHPVLLLHRSTNRQRLHGDREPPAELHGPPSTRYELLNNIIIKANRAASDCRLAELLYRGCVWQPARAGSPQHVELPPDGDKHRWPHHGTGRLCRCRQLRIWDRLVVWHTVPERAPLARDAHYHDARGPGEYY